MISESFKQDLLNRVDIVDVVSARVQLKKSGANWSGLCPFHTEKTPSFTVSPSKQFYHCFGCGAHGNAIGFLMEYAGLGYVEAVRELAESVGMKLPEFEPRDGRGARKPDAGPDLYDVMERAAKYYREQLKGSPRAIDYLKRRGLTGKIAAQFGIGYAPDGWQNLQSVFPDYSDKALVECGLVIVNDEGRRYDRFRDRVMFPILNQRGIVIGFGGRVVGEGEPKYLNSPETPLFEKGRELYGLPQARIAIRDANRVIVVEGYMDVVALAQHGVANAVATLGTATTPVHVQKLLRQADEVVFCFDGDAAGRRAAWHALEVSLPALADRKTVKFLFLPPEHDPDSFVREHGKAAFEAKLAEAEPLSAFLLRELKARADLATLEGRSKLIADAKPLMKKIGAPALQLQLLRALSEITSMGQADVARLIEVRVSSAPAPRPTARRDDRGAARRGTEAKLLRAVLCMPALARELPIGLVAGDSPECMALRAVADRIAHDAAAANARPVSSAFDAEPYHPLLVALEADLLEFALDDAEMRVEFEGGVRALHAQAKSHEIKTLHEKGGREGLSMPERERLRLLLAELHALRQPAGPGREVVPGPGAPT